MKLFGRELVWSEPLEIRSLEPVVTDIGVAFSTAIAEAEGTTSSHSIPAVYRSVQLITDIVAALPMESIGADGLAHPINSDLLTQPNPLEIYNSTLRKIVASLLLRGEAYLRPVTFSNTGQIRSVQVLNPDEVTVSWDSLQMYPVYSWRNRTLRRLEEIYPISMNLWPGRLKGIGPIEAARLMYSGIRSEANMARRIFEDEATPTGLLKVARALTKPEADQVRDDWETSHGGRKRPAVLSGGVEFEQITINPVDAQFIEQRNFSVQEVARMFGLDGWFLNVESGSSLTYTTTEGLFRQLLTTLISPTYLEPIEQTFSLLLPQGERARFNTDEVLRADLEARYRSYEIGLRAGFLTPDDVRQSERLPRLERSLLPIPQPAEEAK